MVVAGEAPRLVRAVYGALDLFSGSESDLLVWAKRLSDDCSGDELLPTYFSLDGQAVLARHLADAGVLNEDGDVDPYALRGFQRVIELLPHFRAEEVARKPGESWSGWEARIHNTEHRVLPTALKRVIHVMKHDVDVSKGQFPW